MPAALVLLSLLLGLACGHEADSQVSAAPTEFVDEALQHFVGKELIVDVTRAPEVEGQKSPPRIPRQVRLLGTHDGRWGRSGFDLSEQDPDVNWRATFWTDSENALEADQAGPTQPARLELVFSSGCGNCGGYRAELSAKGETLEGVIYSFASRMKERDTGYRIALKSVDPLRD